MISFDLPGCAKKAIHTFVGAFFYVWIFFSISPLYATTSCTLKGPSETVKWDYIADGDSLTLKDGRKIRFPSINTPEIAHENKSADPFGDLASLTLKQLLSGTQKIRIQAVGKDHHGRVLAHPFLMDGRSIESLLIEKGLAYQLFSEEPDAYRQCLKRQEAEARREKIGVWSKSPVLDIRADRLKPGFAILRGKVVEVANPKKSDFLWVEMDGPVVIRVPKSSLDAAWLKGLIGQRIEFRGWLVDRKEKNKGEGRYKRWMVGIYSRDGIQRLE
ncbi:thermonuclease family protein [Endozoicomonas sp. SESOKO2]|uniref:thermonuclease family protein n=1 Tax=Endozoicomonas sp. SESOKO2 TaxID=2828743 RepID=UPI0021476045|nr:thermonuclease family protein [Endozoicomonas sp. SESOKO2]